MQDIILCHAGSLNDKTSDAHGVYCLLHSWHEASVQTQIDVRSRNPRTQCFISEYMVRFGDGF